MKLCFGKDYDGELDHQKKKSSNIPQFKLSLKNKNFEVQRTLAMIENIPSKTIGKVILKLEKTQKMHMVGLIQNSKLDCGVDCEA